jgi:hypothetical protein
MKRYFIIFWNGLSDRGIPYTDCTFCLICDNFINHELCRKTIKEAYLQRDSVNLIGIGITGFNEVSKEDFEEWNR